MENKDKFEIYKNLLREWSGRMNLVAPSTLSDIDNRHIADSAQLVMLLIWVLGRGSRVLFWQYWDGVSLV